jgi:hypothetical protein
MERALTYGIRVKAQPQMGGIVHKPMRVVSEEAGSQEGDCGVSHCLGMRMKCTYIEHALSKWDKTFWGKFNNKTVRVEAQSEQYHTTWNGLFH